MISFFQYKSNECVDRVFRFKFELHPMTKLKKFKEDHINSVGFTFQQKVENETASL